MIDMTGPIRRLRTPLMVAGAVLALFGCSATHVGETWQCPLAQGSQCTNVAAADPAVKDAADAERLAGKAPLYRARDAAGPVEAGRTAGDCAQGCNPCAWIARLFTDCASDNGDGGEDGATGIGGAEGAARQTAPSDETTVAREPEPDTQASVDAAAGDTHGGEFRVPETIGRVWIAPHVDAGGVYREASWVRIVIAPAKWRRP